MMTPVLYPHTPTGFYTNDLAGLADWLALRDWLPTPSNDPERVFARLLTANGAILILYHTGSVSIQGRHQTRTRALLTPLVATPQAAQLVLPW